MRAVLLVALVACHQGERPVVPNRTPQLTSPEAAVASYFRAGDEAASRWIRAAFHPATPIQWVDEEGTPRSLTQLEWWPKIDGSTEPAAATRVQHVLDRAGELALVEAVSRWADHSFDDLLLLARDRGGWQIVGKVFVRLAPGQAATSAAEDERAVRAVIDQKIAAHAEYDPMLLLASHLPGCRYVHVAEGGATGETLSEAGARYAARRDAHETDHESPWRILKVIVRGPIAAVVTEVRWLGVRNVDHLLLLRTAAGWKIAAASWGPAQ